jgi:hypothetical protein
LSQGQPLLAVQGDIHLVSLKNEATPNEIGDVLLVLD